MGSEMGATTVPVAVGAVAAWSSERGGSSHGDGSLPHGDSATGHGLFSHGDGSLPHGFA
jgi:hypothetical protein